MARDLSVNSKIVDPDKYVYREERDLTQTQVDWDTVTKDLTETIETIRDDRETRKSELEKSQTEAMNKFAEMEQYDSESLNVKVLQGSQWGSEFLASQNALMKRGLLKPSDFMQSKQKVSDSFTQLKSALGKFDAEYKLGQERMNSQVPGEQSNVLEQGIKLGMSGIAGLSQYDFAGNPATGDMNFVKKGADISNPANLLSLNSINQRLTQRSDYVSLTTSASEEVTRLGSQIAASFIEDGQRGAVESIESWLEKADSKDMLKSLVGTVTATEAQQISILQDAGVTAKMMTQDPEEAAANPGDGTPGNPGYVLMVPNGDGQGTLEAELSPLQQDLVDKEAEKIIRSQLDEKLKIEQRLGTTYAPLPNSAGIQDKKERKEAADMYGVTVKLVTGDASESEQAATALAAHANAAITDPEMKIAPGGVQKMEDGSLLITRVNGNTFPVPAEASDGTARSPKEMIDSVFKTLVPDLGNVATAGGEYTNLGNVIPDEIGKYAVTSTGEIEKIEEIKTDPVDVDSPFSSLGNMSPIEYMDTKHGKNIGSADKWPDVTREYTKVLNSIIPQEVASHFLDQGMRFVVYRAGSTSTLKVVVQDKEGANILTEYIYNSDGSNNQIEDHITSISQLANKARDRYLKEANEEAQAANNPPGTGDTAGQGGTTEGDDILESESE